MTLTRSSFRRIGGWILVGAICLLCFELRLVALTQTTVDDPLRADASQYVSYAINITRNGAYSRALPPRQNEHGEYRWDFYRPPGYPLFLALFSNADLNVFLRNALVTQTLANAMAVLFLFALVYRIAGYWPAIGASLLYATAPQIININTLPLTESLTTTLLILFLFALHHALHSRSTTAWLITGFLLAYGALTRPFLQYFVIPLSAYLWFVVDRQSRSRILGATALTVVLLGGWSVFAHLRDDSTGNSLFAMNIYHGIYPDLKYRDFDGSLGWPYLFDPRHEEISASLEATLEELGRRFREEPGRHLAWYLVGKPRMLWQWPLIQGKGEIFVFPVLAHPWDANPLMRISLDIHRLLHWPLVVLAAIGCVLIWIPGASTRCGALLRDPSGPLFLRIVSLLLVYGTLVHLPGIPLPRYHLPLLPAMFLMAMTTLAGAITWLLSIRSGKSEERGNS